MTATSTLPIASTTPTCGEVQDAFLACLPRFRSCARYALRHVACRDTRDDLVCEVVALGWQHFVSLARRGRKPEEFVATLALRCSQAVRSGRRLAKGERTRDALSPVARARGGFMVVRLDEYVPAPGSDPSGPAGDGVVAAALAADPRARHGFAVVYLDEYVTAPGADPTGPAGDGVVAAALAVDPKARVPEQAAFRIDFPEWRARFGRRDRAVLDALAGGSGTGEVAARFALSPPRVSQLREAFRANWLAFHRGG